MVNPMGIIPRALILIGLKHVDIIEKLENELKMNMKLGICESCNRNESLHYVKKKNFTTSPIEETINWLCKDCIDFYINKKTIMVKNEVQI